jgi:hypothetical protein
VVKLCGLAISHYDECRLLSERIQNAMSANRPALYLVRSVRYMLAQSFWSHEKETWQHLLIRLVVVLLLALIAELVWCLWTGRLGFDYGRGTGFFF